MDLKEQQAAYDHGWADALGRQKEQHGNFQANVAFLERADILHAGDKVLEVGCGVGALTDWLHGRGCQIVGTDLSQEAVAYGRKKYPHLDLRVEPAEQIGCPDGSLDAVVSFDVLEHLHQVDRHISEVHRVLRPGGYYLLGTPNKWVDMVFETLTEKGFGWTWAHPSLHSPGQLRRRLLSRGFSCRFVKVNTITDFTLAKLPSWLAGLVRRGNTARWPLWLQSNLYVVAQKLS